MTSSASPYIFGGVDMGHAEIEAAGKRRNRALAIAAIDVPGALPDHGYLGADFPRIFAVFKIASFMEETMGSLPRF